MQDRGDMGGAALYGEDLAFVQQAAFGELARKAAPAIVALLRGASIPIRRVLDVGCGAGITTAALVEAGFVVEAIEPSPGLADCARAAVPGATITCASIDDVELRPCEAIVAFGEPLTYCAPDVDAAARMRTRFARFARALPRGGVLLFDLIVAGDESLDARSFRSELDWALLYETSEDRDASRLVRHIETFRRRDGDLYRRARETHHVAVFESGAILQWLTSAGFTAAAHDHIGDTALFTRRRLFTATRSGE